MAKTLKIGKLEITTAASMLRTDDVINALERHENCDWGYLSEREKELNNIAADNEDSLIYSVHVDSNGQIFWIITEADRSVTRVSVPEEDDGVPLLTAIVKRSPFKHN